MKTMTSYRTKASRFKVLVAVECIKEYTVMAIDKEEAEEIALGRATQKNKVLANRDFIIGDIEVALIEEIKNERS